MANRLEAIVHELLNNGWSGDNVSQEVQEIIGEWEQLNGS